VTTAFSIGLVIPGRNCGRTLERCLSAVVPLLASGELSEIIFVNDHSEDDTLERARSFPHVRIMDSAGEGAGAARNTGFRACSAELVWFIDSDCVPEPNALSRLRQSMAELGADVIGGSYGNLMPDDLLASLIHEEIVARHEAMGASVTFAITANLLCRRSVLVSLDGFDESLKLAQDLDLAYRVVAKGYRLCFDARSRVGHFHETRLLPYCVKQARQGYWRMHLYARHPRRVSGDSYSGWLDYAQPPLAVVSAGALLLGGLTRGVALRRACLALAGGGFVALVVAQLPYTWRLLGRTRQPRMLAYAPMSMLRAGFRGAGMLLGVAELGLGRLRR
jgi:glycosyltransferase involved in cell wall biosynthesis